MIKNDKKFLKYSFIVLALLISYTSVNILNSAPAYSQTQTIVAVVNDDIISINDLNKRIYLIMASSGLPNTKAIKQKLSHQVLNGLINEQLMLQEAKKIGVKVTQEEINEGFAQIAQQNKMKPKEFLSMLKRGNIDISTMYQQIKAQLAWGKVIQSKLRPRITISERDINDTLERISAKIGTTEYLIAEIYLPIEDIKKENQVKSFAFNLVHEIKAGKASFFKLAQQFSQSAGALNGGDKGWVSEAQLPKELLQEIKKINKNQITNPIKLKNGYHIIMLRNKRILSQDTLPSHQQIEYNIGTERLNKLQQQYLLDLRLASFIDIRI